MEHSHDSVMHWTDDGETMLQPIYSIVYNINDIVTVTRVDAYSEQESKT